MLRSIQSWFRDRSRPLAGWRDRLSPRRVTYPKQMLLFLVAVVLPSSALVLLSLRMMAQEKELGEKRFRERREQAGREFGAMLLRELREIAARVESLGSDQVRNGEWMGLDPDLGLVALVSNDRLILPWDHNVEAEAIAELLRQAPFGESLATAQRLEFGQGDLRLALASYRTAADLADSPVQSAYASLGAARLLSKLNATEEAQTQFASLLKLPLSVRDEFDVPISLYAAGQILNEGWELGEAFSSIADAGVSGRLSPAATYMVRDYFDQLRTHSPVAKGRAESFLPRLQTRIALQEQWQQLKNEFQGVKAALAPDEAGPGDATRWTIYGAEPSVVGLVHLRGAEAPVLVAVKAGNLCDRAFQALGFNKFADPRPRENAPTRTSHSPSSVPRIVRGQNAQGLWLGEEFPNLQVILPIFAGALQGSDPQLLYSALIVLVVGITLFGAHLWWRDTQRELRLADMRSDFVSSVSHELKTPLTSVRMLAETLRMRQVPTETRHEYLDLILSESERLGRLLKNVLDFATIEKGMKVYGMELVELGSVIDAAVRCIQHPLREKNLDLQISNRVVEVTLSADRDALEQAVLNLLHNAIKYSSKDSRIELRASQMDGEAIIQVRDYGVGIHPRDHPRIFERFYRAPEDHNRKIPGTGLGLALVKHIIEAHGGRVTVESAPGQGSTFTLHLPLRE